MKQALFGSRLGFGAGKKGEYYYSQGMSRGQFGPALGYSIVKRKDSTDISGLGNIKFFAQAGTKVYAQDDAGKLYSETTPGALDFSTAIRSPGGNGSGMIGDQKGRLIYSNGSSNNQLGLYDLTAGPPAFTDGFILSIESWQHPLDLYEDLIIYGNKWKVGIIDSADISNAAAFTLPAAFTVDCLRSGKTGVLIGANLNYDGYLILWNPFQAERAIAPWLKTTGRVLSIRAYGSNWVVVTTKEIILTNGYSSKTLFSFLDDPLGFALWNVNPDGTLIVNDKLIILQQKQTTQQLSEFGRMKPGVYVFDLRTRTFEYAPVNTMNTISVSPLAIFATSSYSKSIVLGFADAALSKNYISTLDSSPPATGVLISEVVGADVPTDKDVDSVSLNLGLRTETADAQVLTFNVSVKLYDFTRPLWGKQVTNASAAAANQIRVDGSDATRYRAQVGDEVTVLSGNNAGEIRHITAIDHEGLSNETWTMNSGFSNSTGSDVPLNVQPFKLISKKALSSEDELGDLFFNAKNRPSGQKFLVKVVFDGNSSARPEIHPSILAYEDQGVTSKQ